ncbi:MAG: 50S ribosomal protein L9 [Chloroflexi bacterium]|nr:50S ribosomal protein L9 [Chloroflexota bacterium]
MRVLFLQDVPGTADAGEVHEVKNGYARNYLIPRGLAAPATPDQLQRVRSIQKVAETQRQRETANMEGVAERLRGAALVMETKVGPTGRLYGAVTARTIAEEASRLAQREIDHRGVLLASAIHEPGDYPVTIRLYRDITAVITVSVVPEGYRREQAARAAAGEARPAPVPQAEEAAVEEVRAEVAEEQPQTATEEAAEELERELDQE